MTVGRGLLVLDSSVLINFAAVNEVALLSRLGMTLLVPDQVLVEVTRLEQRLAVDAAIAAGVLEVEPVTSPAEVALFAELRSMGRFGAGECAALAVAVLRGGILAIQDRRAALEGRRRSPGLPIQQTEDLVIDLLRARHLDLRRADELLVLWATQHRFRSRFTSFRDVV